MICMDRRWHSMPNVVWHNMPDVANFKKNNIRRQTCSAAWQSLGTSPDQVMKQIKTLHQWKLDVF